MCFHHGTGHLVDIHATCMHYSILIHNEAPQYQDYTISVKQDELKMPSITMYSRHCNATQSSWSLFVVPVAAEDVVPLYVLELRTFYNKEY